MRTSKILTKLRTGNVARVCCLYSPIAMFPRHAAHAGFDGIWLDNEHNTWESREVQRLIAMHHLADIDCVVRPAFLGATQLYHLLENGATGVMIPHVSSRESARYLVDALKFPPLGRRGQDGAGLDNDFYINGTDGYPELANRQTIVVVQIETAEAIENVDEIAAVKGVDVLFIGPGDLALHYGCPMSWAEPKMEAAQKRVATAATKNGIFWGRPAGSASDMTNLINQGARFIAYGSDFDAVMHSMPHRYLTTFEKALTDSALKITDSKRLR